MTVHLTRHLAPMQSNSGMVSLQGWPSWIQLGRRIVGTASVLMLSGYDHRWSPDGTATVLMPFDIQDRRYHGGTGTTVLVPCRFPQVALGGGWRRCQSKSFCLRHGWRQCCAELSPIPGPSAWSWTPFPGATQTQFHQQRLNVKPI